MKTDVVYVRPEACRFRRAISWGIADQEGPNLVHGKMALAIAALALGSPAFGQVQTGSGALEEIIVTAQKREQKSQDVGITLTALSGEQLREEGITNAVDVAKLTPGVNVSGSFAGQNVMFAIRGVVQQDFNQQSESPVAVYVDENYVASNNVAGVGLFDLDRVEVLKGPQGTLFGRNATGGLVSFTTRKPTDQLTAEANASYGSYAEKRFEAAIGGPLADKVQGRIAVFYDKNNPFVDNTFPTGGPLGGKKTVAARAHLAFQPADDVSFLLTAYDSNTEQSWGPYLFVSTRSTCTNMNGVVVVSDNGTPVPGNAAACTAGSVPNSIVVSAPSPFFSAFGVGTAQPVPDAQRLTFNANDAQSTGGFDRVSGSILKGEWKLGGSQLVSITGYNVVKSHLLLDDDASALPFLNTDNFAEVKNFSEELRDFVSGDKYRWTTGLYYLHIDATVDDIQKVLADGVPLTGGLSLQGNSVFELVTNSYSAFTQAEFEVAPLWTLVAGARATRENKNFTFHTDDQTLAGVTFASGRTFPDAGSPPGDVHENLYAGKLQLEYRPQAGVMYYGGVNRGTKAGGFNAPFLGGPNPVDAQVPYKPEVLYSYEVGAKTTLLDHRLRLNGAVFYYDYRDYQGFKFLNFATIVGNYAADVKGAEFDVEYRPVSALTLSAGAAYVDSIVKNVQAGNAMVPAAVTFATRRAPFTSPWTGTALARYEWSLAAGKLSVQADVQYTGDYFQNLTNFDSTKVDAYTLLGARVAWRDPSGKWEFSATGKNLTDKRYRTVGFDTSDFGGFSQTGYGEPRWVMGMASYRF